MPSRSTLSTVYRDTKKLTSTASSVSFANIPSALQVLEVAWTAADTSGFTVVNIYVRVNGDSTNSYGRQYIQAVNSTVSSGSEVSVSRGEIGLSAGSAASSFASGVLVFPAWNNSLSGFLGYVFKSTLLSSTTTHCYERSGSGSFLVAGPYTSLTFLPEDGAASFTSGTQFSLTGYRKVL